MVCHTELVSACLAATSEVRSVGVCDVCTRVRVWYGVSKRQSNLNPEIKGRGCPSLPFNYSVCGEAVRKPRY